MIKKTGVLILLLLSMGKAYSDEAIWVDVGMGRYSDDLFGSALTVNVMPGEWGVAARYSNLINFDTVFDCIFVAFGTECDGTTGIEEVGFLAKREFDGGRYSAAVGVAWVIEKNRGTAGEDKETIGIPFALTARTKSWRNVGFSAALVGNVNDLQSFYGVNFQIEMGSRYRE